MFGFQETHGKEAELSLDDFRLALLNHDGATTVGIRFPVDFLYLHTRKSAVLAEEFQRVDVPATNATLFVRRGGLEGAWPVGPGILRIVWSLYRTGHDLNLSNALAPLTMSSANTVRACIATTYHEYILALGADAFVL